MSRVSTVLNQIRAAYAGQSDTKWYVGEEHDGRHNNAERIVSSIVSSVVTPGPGRGAWQGDRRDVAPWSRAVVIRTVIWSRTFDRAESRLHAWLVAMATVLGVASDAVTGLTEQWSPPGIAGSGSQVALTWTLRINVLASDVEVVTDDASPGAGHNTIPVTAATVVGELADTETGPVVIVPDP